METRRQHAVHDDIHDLLNGYDIEELRHQTGTIYAIDREFRLRFVNEGWHRFAGENGVADDFVEAWPFGRCVIDAIPEVLRSFYRNAYLDSLISGAVWNHDYECSSPATYRRFHQTIYPLSAGRGLLVVNSIAVEREHDDSRVALSPDPGYADGNGVVHQCCHCRRIKAQVDGERWDWVPAWVERPSRRVSHGLCPICLAHYYPDTL